MARLLTPEVFGQFAIASILIAMMTILTEMGLGSALVQKERLDETDRSIVFLSNLAIASLIFLLLCFMAEPLSRKLGMSLSSPLILVLGANLVVVSLGMASKATLQRQMRFNKIVFATSVSYLVGTLIVGIAIAALGYGVWALVLGLLVNNSVLTIYFLVQAPIKLSAIKFTSAWLSMMRYGAGLCLVQGVNQLSRMSDKAILASVSTLGFVGLYERTQQVQQMPGVFLGGVFDNVLFPALSRLSRNRTELADQFFLFCTPAMMISAYLAVLIFTFSTDLVTILLGSQWIEAIPVLRLLAVLTFFQLIGRLSDTYVRATGIFTSSIVVKVCFLVLVLVSAYAGFRLAGGFGAITGIVFAGVIHAIMMLLVCCRHGGYSKFELMKRAQPALVLACVLLVKNALLSAVSTESVLLNIAAVILSDIIVLCLLYQMTFLMGFENRLYLDRRLKEFFVLVKARLP